MASKTHEALIKRGLSTSQVEFLIKKKLNVRKLQLMSKQQLDDLGLSELDIEKIQDKSRPPIPDEIFNKVLYESNYTCCICRDSTKPIIIHHIVPWNESHSHDEKNLVVLCVEHHDAAHTKHDHSLNLTDKRIKNAKEQWVTSVKEYERKNALGIIKRNAVCWDYFNINRIYELVDNLKIDICEDNKYFNILYKNKYISKDGLLIDNAYQWPININSSLFWLDFVGAQNISQFFATIMKKIICKSNIKVLNNIWDKNKIDNIVKSGDIVIYNGFFNYKKMNKITAGRNQLRLGYTKSTGIKLEFSFDLWYSNSSSAYIDHLTGKTNSTVCAIVREVLDEEKLVTLKCSVLSIGCGYNLFDFDETERDISLDIDI